MNNDRMDEEWEVEKILDKSTSKHGRILYLVKWKNFNEAASSWEPLENLSCPDLVAEFEEELSKQNQSEAEAAPAIDVVSVGGVISSGAISTSGRPMNSNTPSPAHPSSSDRESSVDSARVAPSTAILAAPMDVSIPSMSHSSGHDEDALARAEARFVEGYIPERILGAINIQDSIRFLIKWKGRSECDLVHSKTARRKCPQLVLDFYETNIQWT